MAGGNKKSCGEVLSGRGTFEQLHAGGDGAFAGVLINLMAYAIVLTNPHDFWNTAPRSLVRRIVAGHSEY